MSEKDVDHVLAFDTLYTTNHIQMMKILLPHLPKDQKNQFAVMIKYMELQYAIAYAEKTKHQINICTASHPEPIDFSTLFDELQPYCTEAEKKNFSHMKETFQTLHMFQDLQKYKDLFSSMSGSSTDNNGDSNGDSNMDFSQMLKGMLSPEQQAMFDMFQSQSTDEGS
ncbi:MAG: hypothetical protein PHE02_15055 [Lachnospiraceae bacterium]|nr:hypothetical protein [Lachnospiraceae bacterium]